MKRGLLCFLVFLMATSGLSGAVPIQISEEFFNEDIVVFYLSDFNLENPQGNPLIFEYYIGNTRLFLPISPIFSFPMIALPR
ncbi:MAG: hypothetical protein XD77_0102 [Marinimicrobia bacterium 46_47]|nr:MAG: hypothetical protein XD77_0102 [Marinimicrobia bacterium 46_47]